MMEKAVTEPHPVESLNNAVASPELDREAFHRQERHGDS
jgi:hypothetical protein